ncbi:aspartate/glutamate racemase family protein [Rhodospirillum sp. A1_3_36]|uniref:aspartate/glutamate racemase family protein n=1 Tax=Rhodospirillum sp. A1_3_36 TaxID=3391666 RepID=UPI0039A62B97
MSEKPAGVGPRIALIHALEDSVLPARAAFAEEWPEAFAFDLLDTSLAIDLAEVGTLDTAMMDRFQTLADYAVGLDGKAGQTQAILFTCSAFGPAIDAVKARLSLPVLRPNESAFEEALDRGSRLALVVTFGPSLAALEAELHAMAAARGREVTVTPIFVEGALAALKAGDGATHDRLAREACRGVGEVDAVILGQFSLARAAAQVQSVTSAPVLTTPGCAVRALRGKMSPR